MLCHTLQIEAHTAEEANVKLGKWLEKEGRRATWIARHCGVSRATVKGWIDGAFNPSASNCAKIAEVTADEVRARDFVAEEILPSIPPRPSTLETA